MKILTIQSSDIDLSKKVFADGTKCNYRHALPVYKHLFSDYNDKFDTNYESFFWGFSDLLKVSTDIAIKRACEMLQTSLDNRIILLLDVPDNICLETDFYNFSDEIFAHEFPDELESCWESIYENRNAEKQVIFPYIEPNMIIEMINGEDIYL